MPVDLDPTNDLASLGYAEHLLIWSFRACAMGRWPCAMLEREYRDACGPAAAAEARGAVRAFARALETQTRRPIVLSPPGRLTVTGDEQRLIAIYAAAQDEDRARCETHLRRLLARPPNPHLFPLVQATAQALRVRGHRFTATPIDLPLSRPVWAIAAGAAA